MQVLHINFRTKEVKMLNKTKKKKRLKQIFEWQLQSADVIEILKGKRKTTFAVPHLSLLVKTISKCSIS